jgi:transposase-like protein
VPRDRKNDFRPYILPEKRQKVEDSYERLLFALVSSGYSESQLTKILRDLGLPYSEAEMKK